MFPRRQFSCLGHWVEKGKAPDTLFALAVPTATDSADLPIRTAHLCSHPKVLTYAKGNIDKASTFSCE